MLHTDKNWTASLQQHEFVLKLVAAAAMISSCCNNLIFSGIIAAELSLNLI
jgi:hypothetical protein